MMKRLIFIMFLTSLLTACAVTKQTDSAIGVYKGKTEAGEWYPAGVMTLSLMKNGTFELNWLEIDYSGKWEKLDAKHIRLKFNPITSHLIMLRSGTLSGEEDIMIELINKNRIILLPYQRVLMRIREYSN